MPCPCTPRAGGGRGAALGGREVDRVVDRDGFDVFGAEVDQAHPGQHLALEVVVGKLRGDDADGGDSEENGCYGVCNRDIDGEGVLLDWSWDYLARRARCKAEYFIGTQRFTKLSQSEVIFLRFLGGSLY